MESVGFSMFSIYDAPVVQVLLKI